MSQKCIIGELKEAFQTVVAEAADPDFDASHDLLDDVIDRKAFECHTQLMNNNPVYREIFKKYSGLNRGILSPEYADDDDETEIDESPAKEIAKTLFALAIRTLNLPRVFFYEWRMLNIATPLFLDREVK